MLEVCDLAYVFQLERIERRVLVDRQALMQAAITSGADIDLPTVQEAWDRFDAALVDDTVVVRQPVDPDREDMLRALGILR